MGDANFCPGAGNGGQCNEWNWYKNGVLIEAQGGIVTENLLPEAKTWLLCGRSGNAALRAQIDEVRSTGQARVLNPPPGQEQELGFLISSPSTQIGSYFRF